MASFNDFVNAIVGQESGGNYRAVNGRTGAMGYAQVMPTNIAPWSREVLGYSVTPSQFLNSPALQRKIVEGKLKQYYDKWGAQGAAAAWYAGPGNHDAYNSNWGGVGNEPSVKQYVDSVVSRMGGDYGYVPETTVDNRVQNTPIAEVLQQEQPTQKLDALSGTDRNGLGLQQIKAQGTEAATGGVGLDAPQVAMPSAESGQKAAVGDTFQQNWQAADQMQAGSADALRQAAIEMGEQFIGKPYKWGFADPSVGFDCSGLIQYALGQVGVNIARTSWDQIASGQRTDLSALKPGDLVGFRDGSHIAMWLGDGKILEAPRTGLDVRVRNLGKNESAFGVSLDDLYK